MLNNLLSKLAGPPAFASGFTTEHLMRLFSQLGSAHPRGDLIRVERRERSLIGICLQLLSIGERASDQEFVHRAYRGFLGRKPDERGFQNYVGGLSSGFICRADVIDSFLNSQEFRKRMGVMSSDTHVPLPRVGRLRAYVTDYLQRMFYAERLLPPLSMRRRVGEKLGDVSGGRFEITGRNFVEKLSRDAGLGPESRVLDLGCGCGRLAIPLTEVIGPSGHYRGLEAAKGMVNWCRRNITPGFPHFQFIHCDVRNKAFNPRGREKPGAFRFPFDETSFDLVVATSVFTHLLPDAALNYIRECGRVLRGGGILFATFFLVDSGIRSKYDELSFHHPLQGAALSIDSNCPEKGVAYRADWLLSVCQQSWLELLPPIRWGAWSGKTPAYSGQDVLIFRKR